MSDEAAKPHVSVRLCAVAVCNDAKVQHKRPQLIGHVCFFLTVMNNSIA
jgi:hypothetical protein